MSAPRRLVAGVDSSTQSCKVVVVDLATGTIERSAATPHPEGTEVDPEHWWQALTKTLRDAGGLQDVAAIGIAAQQHGMVALDAAGQVVRHASLWHDMRSTEDARDLVGEIGAEQYARRTGLVPVASFTAPKLRWLRRKEPDNAARVAAVALPHDWLTWRLLGNEDPELLVTDASDASGTGYLGATGGYDLDLFQRAFGVAGREAGEGSTDTDTVILPRVLAPDARAGTIEDGTVVSAGAGDNAAASLGLAVGAGRVVASIGTSGTVHTRTAGPVTDPTGMVAGFRSADGGYLPLVGSLNSARVLDAAAQTLRATHQEVADLAVASPPGADGLTLVPYFEGERSPLLPEATAHLVGMTLANTRPRHVARAFVESVLCSLADGLDALRAVLDTEPDHLMLIGGGTRNAAIREVARHVFTLPIDVPENREWVAFGAARQAGWALTGELAPWPTPPAERLAPVDSDVLDQYREATREVTGTPPCDARPTAHGTARTR